MNRFMLIILKPFLYISYAFRECRDVLIKQWRSSSSNAVCEMRK